MSKNVINKPRISNWIGGLYTIITIFIAIIYLVITFLSDIRSEDIYSQLFLFGVMIFVLSLMSLMIKSLYKTKYTLKDGVLYSWSPFAIINLKLKDIEKVERTLIPFHIRVGASFYSGRFYIPSLGWARAIITNLSDGVLITTKDKKHYLITPSNPDKFVKLLKP